MLYDMKWLEPGSAFPPRVEEQRIQRYIQNAMLFDGEHFAGSMRRHRCGVNSEAIGVYEECIRRISTVVGNFEDIISAPVLLNYNRFISLKMADLVAGEHPTITGKDDAENRKIKWIRDHTNFDAKLFSSVIDISRYGDVPIRFYKDADGYFTFTIWDATGWYPIVSQDGTNTITHHCLCWVHNANESSNADEQPDWYLHVQIHDVNNPGQYEYRVYHNGGRLEVVGKLESSTTVLTGLDTCAVLPIRAFEVSGTVYGYDDYMPIDSLLAEIMTRVSQISVILDKHADPSLAGPSTMLKRNPVTGSLYLEMGKFFIVNEGDQMPQYLTWDGQLNAAFQQLEFLINQLYILSEMGAALTGGVGEGANAVSGTAMRFKMVNPLAKARRVSNALIAPVRKIFSVIGSSLPEIDADTEEPGSGDDTALPYGHISVQWEDGLPNDPREQLEICKLATGEQKMIPLEDGLVAYLKKSAAEAMELADKVREQAIQAQREQMQLQAEQVVNKPGPQDGTGVNPQKKGGKVSNFQSENNKKPEDK